MGHGIGVGDGKLREFARIQWGFQGGRWDEKRAVMQGLG